MDKVVKREVVIQKESEKSAKRNTRAVKGTTRSAVTARAVENQAETDSRDSSWNSYPIEELSPEQRKHFKEIMRKEARK